MLDTRWEKGFTLLQQFVAREGHAAVPDYHVENGLRLGAWVSELHSMRKHWHTLSEERIELLETLEDWQWSWQGIYHSKHNPYPFGHIEPRRIFLEMADAERAALTYDCLSARGIHKEETVLRDLADHSSLVRPLDDFETLLTEQELVDALHGAIDTAVELAYLDRPLKGHLRSLLTTPEDFSDEDWSMVVFMTLRDRPLRQGELLRQATAWAAENCGLSCEELTEIGKVRESLKEAIRIDIVRREIEKLSGGLLRTCC
jgi:hypothetical protein